jgi:hypothetical protein
MTEELKTVPELLDQLELAKKSVESVSDYIQTVSDVFKELREGFEKIHIALGKSE